MKRSPLILSKCEIIFKLQQTPANFVCIYNMWSFISYVSVEKRFGKVYFAWKNTDTVCLLDFSSDNLKAITIHRMQFEVYFLMIRSIIGCCFQANFLMKVRCSLCMYVFICYTFCVFFTYIKKHQTAFYEIQFPALMTTKFHGIQNPLLSAKSSNK